jgi:hypothetical protein
MLGELNAAQTEDLLRNSVIGRIGCHAFGKTYVVPITYAYDGKAIYAHSKEGMKLHMMRENPHVSFEVDYIDSVGNWESVIAFGLFQELAGDEARKRFAWLVDELSNRLNGPPGETVHPTDGTAPAVVYRIVLEEKSGRFERRL